MELWKHLKTKPFWWAIVTLAQTAYLQLLRNSVLYEPNEMLKFTLEKTKRTQAIKMSYTCALYWNWISQCTGWPHQMSGTATFHTAFTYAQGNGNLYILNGKASFFGTKKKTQDFKAEKYKNPDIVLLHNLHTILQC